MIGRQFGARTQRGSGLVDERDDRSLLADALDDPQAFEPIFNRYWDAVYRYCLFRLDQREDAEDAAIEILTNAYGSLSRFSEQQGTFRSWLFAIAHHDIVNRYRYRARHPDRPLELARPLIDPSPLPEEHAIRSVGIAEARNVLKRLPERPRRVTELRLAGLADLEIAAVLDISHAAVRQAQSRAVAQLRIAMGLDAAGREVSRG